jgi:hypothetical protein
MLAACFLPFMFALSSVSTTPKSEKVHARKQRHKKQKKPVIADPFHSYSSFPLKSQYNYSINVHDIPVRVSVKSIFTEEETKIVRPSFIPAFCRTFTVSPSGSIHRLFLPHLHRESRADDRARFPSALYSSYGQEKTWQQQDPGRSHTSN